MRIDKKCYLRSTTRPKVTYTQYFMSVFNTYAIFHVRFHRIRIITCLKRYTYAILLAQTQVIAVKHIMFIYSLVRSKTSLCSTMT